MNKLLPAELEDGWFHEHVHVQREQMAMSLKKPSSTLASLTVPLLERPPVGEDSLC